MSTPIGQIQTTPASSVAASPSESASSKSTLERGFSRFLAGLFGPSRALLGVAGMDMSKLGERLSSAYGSLTKAISYESQKAGLEKLR